MTIKDIRKQCKNHIKKLERSQFSVSMHAPHDSERGKLMLAISQNPPRSTDELFQQLSSIAGQVKERTPLKERRHKLRMSLLYVDPSKSGNHWIRPRSMSLVGTQRFIGQALLDYFYYYDRIEQVYPDDGDEFFDEIRRWNARPQLHSPIELSNQLLCEQVQ